MEAAHVCYDELLYFIEDINPADNRISTLKELPEFLKKFITYYEDIVSKFDAAQEKGTEKAKKLSEEFQKENGMPFTATAYFALERSAERSSIILEDAKKMISELEPLVDPENYPLPSANSSPEDPGL